jgi:uncharacterized protein (TIGR03437 family)
MAASRADGALVLAQPAVLIDETPAAVFYFDSAPGFVALWQVKVLLPADAGASVDLVVEAGGLRSNTFRWNNPDAL